MIFLALMLMFGAGFGAAVLGTIATYQAHGRCPVCEGRKR